MFVLQELLDVGVELEEIQSWFITQIIEMQ